MKKRIEDITTTVKNWRYGVGMVVVDAKRRVWMGRRPFVWNYAWQFPQGGMEVGETPIVAAKRELKEELGVEVESILHTHPEVLHYRLPHVLAERIGFYGQTQQWFVVSIASKACININKEFIQWAWIPVVDIPTIIKTMVVPFKRPIYTELLPVIQRVCGVLEPDS